MVRQPRYGLRSSVRNLLFSKTIYYGLVVLDGPQGFTLAITDAINKFFKYAKLSELNKQARKK